MKGAMKGFSPFLTTTLPLLVFNSPSPGLSLQGRGNMWREYNSLGGERNYLVLSATKFIRLLRSISPYQLN